MSGSGAVRIVQAVAESGLLRPGQTAVAMCSGGPDSTALLAGITGFLGTDAVVALHLNYGLRAEAGEDEAVCAELCERLGVELVVHRPVIEGEGNIQARARELRYAAADRLRSERGFDRIATGHTRTDLAETVLYRLATSPGSRALLGLPAARGTIVRPLLELGRAEVREAVTAAGLPFRDDATNESPLYARNRIRNEVMPVLTEIGPAAEATIAETRAELAEEAEALRRLADEALEAAGAAAGAVPAEGLAGLDPAIRRLALRTLAERAAGGPVALGRSRAAEIVRLAASPEGGTVELGSGVEARIEHGHIRFARPTAGPPGEARLSVPGSCRFGGWEVRAELRAGPVRPSDPDEALLDPTALGDALVVRSWRDGDRVRPVGLGGTKSLQDLFTDQKIPRSLRRELPVVTSGERIAWIAGVAVSEEFAAERGAGQAAVLSASAVAELDPA
jgi:tRNA(Ile)-lysidine synthase